MVLLCFSYEAQKELQITNLMNENIAHYLYFSYVFLFELDFLFLS